MSGADDGAVVGAVGTGPQEPGANARSPIFRVLMWVLVLLVIAGVAAAGFFYLRARDRTRQTDSAIARASALLEGAEGDLLKVDEAVQAEISSTIVTQSVEAVALAKSVHKDVTDASKILSDVMPQLSEDETALASALKDSADARAEMMEIAPVILEADRQAAITIPLGDQAVAEIKGAEDLSTQAVVEFNKHTAEGVKASDDYSVQAEARLTAAASLLTSATASFPGADFSAFQGYVSAKIGLIALAKEIDSLWLVGNVAGSNTKLDAYNQRDAEIVAMAKALPASVRDPIANAYTAETADASTRYFEARERARSAGDRVATLRQAATK